MLYSKRKTKSFALKTALFAALCGTFFAFLVSCGDPLNEFDGGTEEEFRAFAISSDSFEYFEGYDLNEFPELFDNLSEEEKLMLKSDILNEDKTLKTGYVINISSKKIHLGSCGVAETIKDKNRQESDSIEYYLSVGFSKCASCFKDD